MQNDMIRRNPENIRRIVQEDKRKPRPLVIPRLAAGATCGHAGELDDMFASRDVYDRIKTKLA